MSDKVIFLDVDGVLNTVFTKETLPSGVQFVEDRKVKILKDIVDKTGAKIVLSSTWRVGWFDERDGFVDSVFTDDFNALKNKLAEFGIEVYDVTPILKNYVYEDHVCYRGDEINEYLCNHPNIYAYAILDDMDGKFLRPCSAHHVQTSILKGLQQKHIKSIERAFKLGI